MHETNIARSVLGARPVKREIIEIVAEIGSGRAGRNRRKASPAQMRGELGSGNRRVEADVGAIKDRAPVENGPACILPEIDQIASRVLDAEAARALVQAEMQSEARPMVLNQSRTTSRDFGPFGGQNLAMKIVSETRRLALPRELLHEPGRGIFGGARERAEPGEEDARASHDIGLNPAPASKGSKFRGARG